MSEPDAGKAREAVARAHREEWARVVATLTRRFGDLDIADILQSLRNEIRVD